MKRTLHLLVGAMAVPALATSSEAVVPPESGLRATVTQSAGSQLTTVVDAADLGPAATWAHKSAVREQRRAARGVRTYGGTTHSARAAVSRLKRWAAGGVGGYHNQCLRLADDAYGVVSGRTSTALAQWGRARRAGVAHPGSRDIPLGAQMFWRSSHPAGHVATYVGDGKVVSNLPGGAVAVVKWRAMDEWGPYLGWAPPYYK